MFPANVPIRKRYLLKEGFKTFNEHLDMDDQTDNCMVAYPM